MFCERSCYEQSVRLSLRPSVCRTRELQQNEDSSVPNLMSHARSIPLVFRQEEWLGNVPFYLKFFDEIDPPLTLVSLV